MGSCAFYSCSSSFFPYLPSEPETSPSLRMAKRSDPSFLTPLPFNFTVFTPFFFPFPPTTKRTEAADVGKNTFPWSRSLRLSLPPPEATPFFKQNRFFIRP